MAFTNIMLESQYLIGAVATVLLVCLYQVMKSSSRRKSKNKYPPGPKGLPIVGYWPYLGDYPQDVIEKLGDKYGKIFMIPVGQMNVVILNDYQAIKDALIKNGDAFAARPAFFYNASALFPPAGLFLSANDSFKDQRRFIVNILKDFSKVSFGESIFKECEIVMNHISSYKEEPFEPMPLIAGLIANITLRFLFDDHYDYNDPELQRMLRLSQQSDELLGKMAATDFMPWLKYLPDRLTGLNVVNQVQQDFQAMLKKKIDYHQETFNEKRIRDFTDAFINRMNTENKSRKDSIYNYESMLSTIIVLFVGGAGPASVTTSQLLNILTIHPEIQDKIIEEVDNFIGQDRAPQYMDRFNMPYMEATLFEILRYADIAPLGVYRLCTEPVKILGYEIPKDAIVYPHLGKLHHDVDFWKNPTDFDPRHCLDENNKAYRPDYSMPFGAGKRICPGANFGDMMMFLVMTSLMQRFRFYAPPGTVNKIEPITGTFRYLKPFKVCAKKRN